MLVKVTEKRQFTLPAQVLEALGVKPGDCLEILESPEGILLRPWRIDRSRLEPLRGRLRRGVGTFDLDTSRTRGHDPALRD